MGSQKLTVILYDHVEVNFFSIIFIGGKHFSRGRVWVIKG
jgi:hypothetical protein